MAKQQEYETALSLPKRRINIQDDIKKVYLRLQAIFKEREERLAFSEISSKEKEEMVSTFIPLLHLDTQHKIWIEQEGHFKEIWIILKELYEKQNAEELEEMKKEVEEELKRLQDLGEIEIEEEGEEEVEELRFKDSREKREVEEEE